MLAVAMRLQCGHDIGPAAKNTERIPATAGVANPVVSTIEDVLTLVVTVLSVLLWVFAGLVALLALVWMVFGVRKLLKLRGKGPDAAHCPTRKATPAT